MNLGDAYENNVLDYLYGGAPPTPPAGVWLALYTVAPTSAGGGTEVSGGSYARVPIVNDGTQFTNPASGGTKDNAAAFTFPTASASWGTIVAYAFHDDATADSIVTWGDVTGAPALGSGVTPQFLAGVITITAS